MQQFIRISLVATSLGVPFLAQAEVAVIVNPAASTNPSQADVANIFLGKSKLLKGVDQERWSPIKEKFYAVVARKNEAQLKSYWSGLVFTGKGPPLLDYPRSGRHPRPMREVFMTRRGS